MKTSTPEEKNFSSRRTNPSQTLFNGLRKAANNIAAQTAWSMRQRQKKRDIEKQKNQFITFARGVGAAFCEVCDVKYGEYIKFLEDERGEIEDLKKELELTKKELAKEKKEKRKEEREKEKEKEIRKNKEKELETEKNKEKETEIRKNKEKEFEKEENKEKELEIGKNKKKDFEIEKNKEKEIEKGKNREEQKESGRGKEKEKEEKENSEKGKLNPQSHPIDTTAPHIFNIKKSQAPVVIKKIIKDTPSPLLIELEKLKNIFECTWGWQGHAVFSHYKEDLHEVMELCKKEKIKEKEKETEKREKPNKDNKPTLSPDLIPNNDSQMLTGHEQRSQQSKPLLSYDPLTKVENILDFTQESYHQAFPQEKEEIEYNPPGHTHSNLWKNIMTSQENVQQYTPAKKSQTQLNPNLRDINDDNPKSLDTDQNLNKIQKNIKKKKRKKNSSLSNIE